MAKSFLKSASSRRTKGLTVKIPANLYDDIQAFKQQLKDSELDVMFSSTEVCVEALETSLKLAQKEFEVLLAKAVVTQSGMTTEAVLEETRDADGDSDEYAERDETEYDHEVDEDDYEREEDAEDESPKTPVRRIMTNRF